MGNLASWEGPQPDRQGTTCCQACKATRRGKLRVFLLARPARCCCCCRHPEPGRGLRALDGGSAGASPACSRDGGSLDSAPLLCSSCSPPAPVGSVGSCRPGVQQALEQRGGDSLRRIRPPCREQRSEHPQVGSRQEGGGSSLCLGTWGVKSHAETVVRLVPMSRGGHELEECDGCVGSSGQGAPSGAGGGGGAPVVSCSRSSHAGSRGMPGDAALVPAGQAGAVLTPGWISGSSCLCSPQVSAAPRWGAVMVGEPVRASFCCLPLGHHPGLSHPSLFVNTLWLPSSSSSSPLWVGTCSRPAARAGAGTASPLLAQGRPAWAPSAMGTRRWWERGGHRKEKVHRL